MRKEIEWWEMLEWENMESTWHKLSNEIKNKIREAGLAPSYDLSSDEQTE